MSSQQSAAMSSPNSYLVDQEFTNQPDPRSVLCHAVHSWSASGGLQAILSFDKQPKCPESLGLPKSDDMSNLVYLQVSPKCSPFEPFTVTPPEHSLVLCVENYMHLYQFFSQTWSLVRSKLLSNAQVMIEGKEALLLSSNLYFFGHGTSTYKARLGKDLYITATIKSKDTVAVVPAPNRGADSETTPEPITITVTKNDKSLKLPLQATTKLFSDVSAYQVLRQRTQYKSSSSKKHKSV